MRNIIRKWLGIDDSVIIKLSEIDHTLRDLRDDKVTRGNIKTVVAETLQSLFCGESELPYGLEYRNRVFDSIRMITNATSKEVAEITIDRIINNEKFIDDVVARINRKRVES